MLQAEAVERLLSELTQQERTGAVAYLTDSPIPAGERLVLPRLVIDVEQLAWAAFIDRQPQSDWGHACRYLLINDASGEARSFEAQFPPFRPGSPWNWRPVYEAPPSRDS